MDKVSLGSGLTYSMNGDDFVLFGMIRANCHKIISLCALELYVGDICLKLEPYSESFTIFF